MLLAKQVDKVIFLVYVASLRRLSTGSPVVAIIPLEYSRRLKGLWSDGGNERMLFVCKAYVDLLLV
jgi:hypothetical protein